MSDPSSLSSRITAKIAEWREEEDRHPLYSKARKTCADELETLLREPAREECSVSMTNSRMCEYGTKGCVIRHKGAGTGDEFSSRLPKPPADWKLPLRWDGEDVIDASNRVLVWDGEVGERTAKYFVRLINALGESLLRDARQEDPTEL